MGVIVDWLLGRQPEVEERGQNDTVLSIDDWAALLTQFGFNGHSYTLPGASQEEPDGRFVSMTNSAYKSNGIVFACMLTRMLLFSEVRFQYRQIRSGRPGKLFGSPDLAVLETPWPGGTTGDLLSKMIQHADLSGNAYVARTGRDRLMVLRPDWVDIVIGADEDSTVGAWDVGSEVLGYMYWPGGKQSGKPGVPFMSDQVAHFAPIPDPEAQFRGMAPLTTVTREIMADKAATDHKLRFFENGATPNLIVKFDVDSVEKMRPWVEMFKENHEGSSNAYKTLFLAAGADATPVGADFQQLDFKNTQGAGETRIAAAFGVPPVIVGLSEGLQAATYSNYGQARRRFADGTMSPLWRNASASLARIINVPSGAELWYDARDIPFLKEDQKDAAAIQAQEAATIKSLIDAGFTPESARDAVVAGDFQVLDHTGLYSVQLQPPNTNPPSTPVPTVNGTNSQRQILQIADLLTKTEA